MTADMRAPLCEEAIRLARLLLRLFPERAGDHGADGAAAAAACARRRAVRRRRRDRPARRSGPQRCGTGKLIAEGLALIDKAMRHRRPGPYQVQAAIAALHARAARPEDTDWAQIDLLYGALERLQPSPVVTLNRAVAVAKVRGPEAALAMIEPLAPRLVRLFLFLRRARRLPDAARPRRGGARRLRPRHRARQHAGRSRPHPHASRPPDA